MVQAAFVLDNVDDSNKCSSRTEKNLTSYTQSNAGLSKTFLAETCVKENKEED